MNKATKIAILVVIVAATVAGLAFYATRSSKTAEAPQLTKDQPLQQQTQARKSDESLPSLPADNKEAIKTEIKGIEESISAVDAELSTDTEDGELGL